MSKTVIIQKVKQYAELLKSQLPVEMIILQKAYAGEEFKKDYEIEVVVVVDKMDRDYIEVKDELTQLANQVDPHIDPTLIEKDKDDPTGFFEDIRKTGKVIYKK